MCCTRLCKGESQVVRAGFFTSRLDDDDAIAVDYVERILAAAPDAGCHAIVFDWGFTSVNSRLYWQPLPRGPFASVLADLRESICTVLDYEHEHLEDVMPVVHFGRPSAWLEVIHGENLSIA